MKFVRKHKDIQIRITITETMNTHPTSGTTNIINSDMLCVICNAGNYCFLHYQSFIDNKSNYIHEKVKVTNIGH